MLSFLIFWPRPFHEIVQPLENISHPEQNAIHTCLSVPFQLTYPSTHSSIGESEAN